MVEPADNPDLGTIPLARLALARLTEVDVHATYLGIDAPDWSSTLVEVGLPTRLAWLAARPIVGSSRDLQALLPGSPLRYPLRFSDDVAFAQSFAKAFPGP